MNQDYGEYDFMEKIIYGTQNTTVFKIEFGYDEINTKI